MKELEQKKEMNRGEAESQVSETAMKADETVFSSKENDCSKNPEIPKVIEGWTLDEEISRPQEDYYLFRMRNLMCGVCKKNGHWEKHYGSIRPVGVNIRRDKFNTLEEALASWWHPAYRRNPPQKKDD